MEAPSLQIAHQTCQVHIMHQMLRTRLKNTELLIDSIVDYYHFSFVHLRVHYPNMPLSSIFLESVRGHRKGADRRGGGAGSEGQEAQDMASRQLAGQDTSVWKAS
jgi:hypothetical protein